MFSIEVNSESGDRFVEKVSNEVKELLVYVARSWSEMTTGEIGKRLGRDPSMISRLYRDYEGKRDRQREQRLSRLLSRRVQTHA